MPKLPDIRVPRLITTSAVHAVRAAIDDAVRLGLTWRLRPGTVGGQGASAPEGVPVRLDGDSATVYTRSMVGALMAGQRVWCVQIPPAGIYVLGIIGVSQSTPTVQLITATGSYVRPQGLTFIRGKISGGGGAGGGGAATAAGQASMGGGGGGGCGAEFIMAADEIPSSVTVTIGAGGTAVAGGAGNSGGTTNFGGLVTANGGSGGQSRTASAVAFGVEPGDGGATIGGTFTSTLRGGSAGGPGWGSDNGLGISGSGGASHMGGGGRARRTTAAGAALTGFVGRQYGGGGSGACCSGVSAATAGGAGAQGVAIIEEFYN
jgi:hypothetical protein